MNKKLNDATPSEWDRAARSNIPYDMTTEEGRQAAWAAYAVPAEEEAEEISLEGCTTEIDWGKDEGMEDLVNHPTHYNSGGIECIEAIEASMELEAFQGYLKGNILKYIWRMSYKGKALEDCEKSQWYLNKLISTLEDNR
jgi:hypothetical protein